MILIHDEKSWGKSEALRTYSSGGVDAYSYLVEIYPEWESEAQSVNMYLTGTWKLRGIRVVESNREIILVANKTGSAVSYTFPMNASYAYTTAIKSWTTSTQNISADTSISIPAHEHVLLVSSDSTNDRNYNNNSYSTIFGADNSAGPTPVATATPTPTPVVTATPTPVVTATPTPVVTATPTPVATATPTPVVTATPTPVVTATPGPVVIVTPARVATAAPTPAVTSSPEPAATATPAPSATASPEQVATTPSSNTKGGGSFAARDLLLFVLAFTLIAVRRRKLLA